MSMRNAISEYRKRLKCILQQQVLLVMQLYLVLLMPLRQLLSTLLKNEGAYAKGGAAVVGDLTAQAIILTGNLPFQVHVFTATTVMADGSYLLVYVETVPTPADVS